MRVLHLVRSTLYTVPGGDTVQVEATAQHLRRAGVSVRVALAGETVDYTAFDLIHFFNITRPADILRHIRQTQKPFVVSTIFVDYADYQRMNEPTAVQLLSRFVSNDGIAYLKTLARGLKGGEPLGGSPYWRWGQRRAIQHVLRRATCLLPNSESEYCRLLHRYGVNQRYRVVVNGVDVSKFGQDTTAVARQADLVLCVARIESGKNQLNLIRALNNSGFRLLLVGRAAPNHQAYYRQCRAAAGENVQFVDHVPQAELIPYYQRASVHALPSWFETTGLVSLEAAALGCNLVITDRGDTRDYFGDYAHYCQPDDPASILAAVRAAASAPPPSQLRDHVRRQYTWEKAAQQTLAAYQAIIPPSTR